MPPFHKHQRIQKTLLQWVNPKLFLLHQGGNDKPHRKITSKTEEQQTWRMKEEET